MISPSLARSEERVQQRVQQPNCKMMIHHVFRRYLRELTHAMATGA